MTLGFYFDDNCAETAVIRALVASGVSCINSNDAGYRGADDETHLERAATLGTALVSSDAYDFPRIHWRWIAEGRSHAGIVILQQQRYGTGEQIARLRRLAVEVDAADMHDRIEYLSDWG